MKIILLYLLIINAAAFLLMLIDKWKAKNNRWRIPERVLFGSAFLGGSIGAIAGMYTVRDKSKHLSFVIGMPAILAAQIFLAIWFITRFA